MNGFQTYGPGDLFELADRSGDQAHVATSGEVTGVALPEWVQAGAVLSPDRARRLGAQLLLAADEHDAIADGALAQFGPPTPGETRRDRTRVEELRSTLIVRLNCVRDPGDRAALRGGVEELAGLRLGDAS